MSSRIVASMLAASVMFGANGTLKEIFGADSRQVRARVNERAVECRMELAGVLLCRRFAGIVCTRSRRRDLRYARCVPREIAGSMFLRRRFPG